MYISAVSQGSSFELSATLLFSSCVLSQKLCVCSMFQAAPHSEYTLIDVTVKELEWVSVLFLMHTQYCLPHFSTTPSPQMEMCFWECMCVFVCGPVVEGPLLRSVPTQMTVCVCLRLRKQEGGNYHHLSFSLTRSPSLFLALLSSVVESQEA